MTTNRARKAAVRGRMADTGENYLTAARRVEPKTPFQATVPDGIDPEDTNLEELVDAAWDPDRKWTDDESPHDNTRRAGFAMEAVGAYARRTRQLGSEDAETAISDMLGDLRHLADALGLDFESLVETGKFHYDAELHGKL